MRSIIAVAVVVLATTLSGCSAVSYKGELDDAEVPYFFTGAFGAEKVNGTTLVVGVWSSLLDTCGLATQFLTDVNDGIDDEDDVIDAMGDFAKDRLPQDWWLQVLLVTAEDDDDLDGAEFGDDGVSMITVVCHFTESIDVDDVGSDSFCGANDQDADIELAFEKDEHLKVTGDFDLISFNSDDGEKIGDLEGSADAGYCEGFSDAFDDFADACSSNAEEGCNPALSTMFAVLAGVPVDEGEGEARDCVSDADCANERDNTVCDADVGVCVAPSFEECTNDDDCFVIDTNNSPIVESDACDSDEVAYVASGRNFCGLADGASGLACSDIDPEFGVASVVNDDGDVIFICVVESAFCDAGVCEF